MVHSIYLEISKKQCVSFSEDRLKTGQVLMKCCVLWYFFGSSLISIVHVKLFSVCNIHVYLRNKFNLWNVDGIMNTSGLLQSK